MDAISDKGLHSYLQHHWVIMELAPRARLASGTTDANHTGQSATLATNAELHASQMTPASPAEAGLLPQGPEIGKQEYPIAGCREDLWDTAEEQKNTSEELVKVRRTSSLEVVRATALADLGPLEDRFSRHADSAQRADLVDEAMPIALTTEAHPSAEQLVSLQPCKDDGLSLAERGLAWFLRIDRSPINFVSCLII